MIYTLIVYGVLRRSGLSTTEYILADIIDGLSSTPKFPYCTMALKDIASELGVDEKTIRRANKTLQERGFIEQKNKFARKSTPFWKELFTEEHLSKQEIMSTYSPVVIENKQDKLEKEQDSLTIEQDSLSPLYNNNNNIYNIYTLPKEFGKNANMRLLSFYNRMLHKTLNIRATLSIPACLKIFNDLLKTENEIVISALLLSYFTYQPKDKNGEWLANTSKSSAYPLGLFIKNVNVFKTYLVNDKGFDIINIDKLYNLMSDYAQDLQNN